MRNLIRGMVVVAGALLLTQASAWGQSAPTAAPAPRRELAVNYDSLRANIVPGNHFWMQGGSLELHGRFHAAWGVVAEVAGQHTADMHGTGVGLDLVTLTFGPRYTWSPRAKRLEIFGQALAGEAIGRNSVFPSPSGTTSNANSIALQLGGGANILCSRHLAVRAFKADWLRTDLGNSATNVQNSLRMGAGLVWRF